jgi:hypothetical protein
MVPDFSFGIGLEARANAQSYALDNIRFVTP